jgi:hypothetical protein
MAFLNPVTVRAGQAQSSAETRTPAAAGMGEDRR